MITASGCTNICCLILQVSRAFAASAAGPYQPSVRAALSWIQQQAFKHQMPFFDTLSNYRRRDGSDAGTGQGYQHRQTHDSSTPDTADGSSQHRARCVFSGLAWQNDCATAIDRPTLVPACMPACAQACQACGPSACVHASILLSQ